MGYASSKTSVAAKFFRKVLSKVDELPVTIILWAVRKVR